MQGQVAFNSIYHVECGKSADLLWRKEYQLDQTAVDVQICDWHTSTSNLSLEQNEQIPTCCSIL